MNKLTEEQLIVISAAIQLELDRRWNDLLEVSRYQPFATIKVVALNDVNRMMLHSFTHYVIQDLRKAKAGNESNPIRIRETEEKVTVVRKERFCSVEDLKKHLPDIE